MKKAFMLMAAAIVFLGLSFDWTGIRQAVAASGGDSPRQAAAGSVYYVDAASGNDDNPGTSVKKAWKSLAKVNGITYQPGDQILFKAGGMWTGQLRPKGSGAEGQPIRIGMYGKGSRPIIDGGGIVDAEKINGINYSSVLLFNNQQYWEVSDLELTNPFANGPSIGRAVYVTGYDVGAIKHMYFDNLYIHDINVKDLSGSLMTGGINFEILGVGDRKHPDEAIKTYFDDIRVENSTFKNLGLMGVVVRNQVYMNRSTTAMGNSADGIIRSDWVPNRNVYIANNYFDTIGGDAIIVAESQGAVVEYNTSKGTHTRPYGYHAAMWAINSDDSLFQYNEAYQTKTTLDGMPFDIDASSNGTTYQYNYSHDNEGGFMLICNFAVSPGAYNQNGTVRYNISQNDKNNVFTFASVNFNTLVHNNTIYLGPGSTAKVIEQGAYASFYNNIFYNLGTGGFTYDKTVNFDHNLYYGNAVPNQPVEKHGIYGKDPQLVAPGTGVIGRSTLSGYRLKPSSPAINAGRAVTNFSSAANSGKDFFGNPAPYGGSSPDIGAVEFQKEALEPPSLNAEFNQAKLDAGWAFFREDKANWQLGTPPGTLTLNATVGSLARTDNTMTNLLAKAAPSYDYELRTKLGFSPDEDGESAGLIVHADDDNYFSISREVNAQGKKFVVKSESVGNLKTMGSFSDSLSSGEVYLKIVRQGNDYSAFFSADGENWTTVASAPGLSLSQPKVGLFATKLKSGSTEAKASFDYIRCSPYDSNPAPIVDDFATDYLDGRWTFLKEDSSRWSLTAKPGSMQIQAGPGSLEGLWTNNLRNIMVMPSPAADFEASVRVDFEPTAEGQESGLLAYQDDNNYISISRKYSASKNGRIYVMKKEQNGAATEVAFKFDPTYREAVSFKLVKMGDKYIAYVRNDKSDWFLIGEADGAQLTNPSVGLFATKAKSSNPDIAALFDDFVYKPVIKPLPSN